MREFSKVGIGFWSSRAVRSLSDDGKLLALYLATGPHSNAAGVFELPDGYACADLRWTPPRVVKAFEELSRKGFATRFEGDDCWVVVHKHFKHNPPENPNQAKHVERLIAQMPRDASVAGMVRKAIEDFRAGFPADVADRIIGSLPPSAPINPDPSGTVRKTVLPTVQQTVSKQRDIDIDIEKTDPLSDSASPASDVIPLEPRKGPSKLADDAWEVISFLNDKTGFHYRRGKTTVGPVMARMKEGFSSRECKSVILRKCREWLNDPKMHKFLRPKTLFGAENFANYVGEVPPEVVTA